MAVTLEALLAPVSQEAPCGPDLSYAVARLDLEKNFHIDVSINTSGRPDAAVEVDWNATVDRIVGEFAQTKDIWLAVYLCRAGAKAGQVEIVTLGAETLAGLFERYWDDVHPRVEEVGLTGRRTACDPLSHKGAFLDPLGSVPVLAHPRLGSFGSEAINRFHKAGAADPDYGMFREALKEMGDARLKASAESFAQFEAALRRADALFAERGQGTSHLDFKPLYAFLAETRKSLGAFFLTPSDAAAPRGSGEEPIAREETGQLRGAVTNREEVVHALDAILQYYQRKEPSSPILPLLERAKAWVSMAFLDVLADIAPESLADAKKVLSKR